VLHLWRLPSGIEVDFVTDDLQLALYAWLNTWS